MTRYLLLAVVATIVAMSVGALALDEATIDPQAPRVCTRNGPFMICDR